MCTDWLRERVTAIPQVTLLMDGRPQTKSPGATLELGVPQVQLTCHGFRECGRPATRPSLAQQAPKAPPGPGPGLGAPFTPVKYYVGSAPDLVRPTALLRGPPKSAPQNTGSPNAPSPASPLGFPGNSMSTPAVSNPGCSLWPPQPGGLWSTEGPGTAFQPRMDQQEE